MANKLLLRNKLCPSWHPQTNGTPLRALSLRAARSNRSALLALVQDVIARCEARILNAFFPFLVH